MRDGGGGNKGVTGLGRNKVGISGCGGEIRGLGENNGGISGWGRGNKAGNKGVRGE